MHLKDQKSLRLTVLITTVLFLLGLLITNLGQLVSDEKYAYIESFLKYKWLLQCTILLLFTFFISMFYYRKIIDIINSGQINSSIGLVRKNKSRQDIEKDFEEALSELTIDEKDVLLQYIESDVRALPFSISNGTVRSLMERKILFLPSGVWEGWKDPSFSINPIAMRILKRNKRFLK